MQGDKTHFSCHCHLGAAQSSEPTLQHQGPFEETMRNLNEEESQCILDVKMFLLHMYVFSQIWLEAFKVNKLLHLKTVFFPFGSSLCFHSLFHRYLKYVLENLPERLLLQKLTMVKFLNDQRHHTLIGRTTWRHWLCLFFLTKLSDATVVKFKVCQ